MIHHEDTKTTKKSDIRLFLSCFVVFLSSW